MTNVVSASPLPVVLVGSLVPLGPNGLLSGIDKRPTPGPWRVTRFGLLGDEQGAQKHHGGPEKASHHYTSTTTRS